MNKYLLAFGLSLLTLPAYAADPYVFLSGGYVASYDRSNSDEVEFGSERGGNLSAGYGTRWEIDSDWSLNTEAAAVGQFIPLHGRNHGQDHRTADGETFTLGALTLSAYPTYNINPQWGVYLGGGVGPAIINALDGTAITGVLTAGVGVRYAITPDLTLDLGEYYYYTLPVSVGGYESTYDSIGPSVKLIWKY